MAFLFTSISGFLALFMLLLTLAVPYLLRKRMRWHYWIGYLILALTSAHMWVSMRAGMARGSNALGLDLATLGLLLILFQVMLGLSLKDADAVSRAGVRRMHFALMLGIVAIALAHFGLNSALLRTLIAN